MDIIAGHEDLVWHACAWVPAGIYHRIIPISEKRISCSFPVAINFRSNEYDTREWIEI